MNHPLPAAAAPPAVSPMPYQVPGVERAIADMFGKIVAANPEAPAVRHGANRMTYAELDRRSHRLALEICARTPADGARVALLLENDLSMVVGWIAAIKSGRICVPLALSQPEERLRVILADSEPVALITDRGHHLLARRLSDGPLIDLDAPAPVPPGIALPAGIDPGTPAYILYTSGSTGRPKGVVQTQRNVLRNVHGLRKGQRLAAQDRLGCLPSLAFGQGVAGLFTALLTGAELCLFDADIAGPGGIAGWLRGHRITVLSTAATTFRQLLRTPEVDLRLPELRTIRVGAEATWRSDVDRFRERFLPTCRLLNGLSCTETTNYAQFFIEQNTELRGDSVPVGRPVDGMEILLRDPAGDPVGPGMAGEIWVRSRYLSPGYWRDPERTRAVFADEPDGRRIYRTGDLGRWSDEGNLEYLGRCDAQVKIRGYRVEPAEIEAALVGHPSVTAAAAVAVIAKEPHESDERWLIAYVQPGENGRPDPAELRNFLRTRLPEYMVPRHLVVLERLPLTPSGKPDRARLTAMPLPADVPAPSSEPPRTALEQEVAAIWAEVLGHAAFGRSDSFLDVGGHSLNATMVLSRIAARFGVAIPAGRFIADPTIAATAAHLATAPADQASGDAELPIRPGMAPDPPPLSFAQHRLWFIDQLEPGSTAYHLHRVIRIEGELNAPALCRALQEIVARHATLRTRFPAADGGPRQVIDPPGLFSVHERDVRAATGPNGSNGSAEAADQLLRELLAQPFDLARGPVFRALLVRTADREHLLALTMHHIVSDIWSRWIIARELTLLYNAFAAGRPSPLDPLPVQYAEYAAWQRARLTGPLLETQLQYWQARLSDLPAALELPTDHPRPRILSASAGRHRMRIPRGLADAAASLARRARTTPFVVLLAAFQTLLHRWSGATDIVVGSPIAGRTRPEIEPLVGFFVNTLVLRGDFSGNPPFIDLLARLHATAWEAYEHQELPLERIVQALNPARDRSRTPLFQAVFALENAPDAPVEMDRLELTPIEVAPGAAKFDLQLTAREDADGLCMVFEFSQELFTAGTVARMAAHFEHLLAAATETPDQRISRLPLVPPDETTRILALGHGPATPFPRDGSIHGEFARQARATPDAVALIAPPADGKAPASALTYGELESRADRLARRIRSRGVGLGDRVAVCAERSPELVIALLAILKAGAAYVPLDPAYPGPRRAFMLSDSGASLLLADARAAAALPVPRIPVLVVGEDSGPDQADDTALPEVGPQAAAYVMYTSGSTGTPKGVVVPHRAVLRLVCGVDYVTLGPDRTLLHLAPISFDASTFELWGALLRGARCVLHPGRIPDLDRLGPFLRVHGVDTLWLTSALFNTVMDHAPSALDGVTQLITGGEALSPDHVRRALARFPGLRLINGYGPTETTTFATCCDLRQAFGPQDRSVPIGRPIADTVVRVLDPSSLQPVPTGVPGELHIGGDGLALGYWNRPELTSARFIPDPHGGPEDRLYRTGDRVRWRADGQLEFLGRFDDQIKIRGFRVEPGEVAYALREIPGVRDAVVFAEGEAADKRLVACVAADPATGLAPQGLAATLAQRLPAHLIPSEWRVAPRLPLGPTGKVVRTSAPTSRDRPALRLASNEDCIVGRVGQSEKCPPSTDTADPPGPAAGTAGTGWLGARMASIWGQLLGRTGVKPEDDFFALGGHSLLAVAMVAEVERQCGIRVPLDALFECATIAHIEQVLRRDPCGIAGRRPFLAFHTTGGRLPFLLLHGDYSGGGFFCSVLAEALGPDRPLYAIHPHGLFSEAIPLTVDEMAVSHLATIREIQPRGPYLLGGFCNGGVIAQEIARRLEAMGETVAVLILHDAFPAPAWLRPLDLVARWIGRVEGDTPAQNRARFRRMRNRLAQFARGVPGWERGNGHPEAATGAEPRRETSSPLWPAYARALRSHFPKPCNAPITAFEASIRRPGWDRLRGRWHDYCRNVTAIPVPGDHWTSVSDPANLRWLAREIAARVDAKQAAESSGPASCV